MTPRGRWVLLAVLLLAFTAAVMVAGRHGGPPSVAGVERLGPESGDLVADYLRRAGGSLPPPRTGPVWALVQLDDYLDPPAATAVVSGPGRSGTRLSGVVLRVPIPGVQTALIFRDVPGQHPAAELRSVLRSAAAQRARSAAAEPPGSRQAAVAAVEAARLRDGCACVLAMVVRADGAVLAELAGRPGVRAVQAAAPGTRYPGLAIAPLLPEQRDVVGPVPDEGPVPPVPTRP